MYRLWFAPMSAAMAPCSVLEAIGAEYELVRLAWDRPFPAALRERHPLGRVPVLEVDGEVVFESARHRHAPESL